MPGSKPGASSTSATLLLPPSGPSGSGWSSIGPFMVCPQRWAYRNLLGIGCDGSPAMTLGSAVHLALAAHYLRVQAKQKGQDPDVYAHPRDVAAIAIQRGELPDMDDEAWRRYSRVLDAVIPKREYEAYTIVAVEDTLPISVGTLRAPGHPQDGQPITYAPRLDLVVQDKKGRYWIRDHKTASVPSKARVAYALHGQFLAMRQIGRVRYGQNFGGAQLHLIQTIPPYNVELVDLPSTPAADAQIKQVLFEAFTRRALLEVETARGERSAWNWPKAYDELTCYHRYGQCFGWDYCCWGAERH